MRRLAALLTLGAGAFIAALFARRSDRSGRERLELYYDDGSSVDLAAASPEAERLLPLARRMLAAARS